MVNTQRSYTSSWGCLHPGSMEESVQYNTFVLTMMPSVMHMSFISWPSRKIFSKYVLGRHALEHNWRLFCSASSKLVCVCVWWKYINEIASEVDGKSAQLNVAWWEARGAGRCGLTTLVSRIIRIGWSARVGKCKVIHVLNSGRWRGIYCRFVLKKCSSIKRVMWGIPSVALCWLLLSGWDAGTQRKCVHITSVWRTGKCSFKTGVSTTAALCGLAGVNTSTA